MTQKEIYMANLQKKLDLGLKHISFTSADIENAADLLARMLQALSREKADLEDSLGSSSLNKK